MTEPTKTRCGHSFCKSCIGKMLRKKNTTCPLCKKSLNRRNVSKDDHLEACITKFTHLVTAVKLDSNIDSEYILQKFSILFLSTFNSCSNQ